MITNQDDPRLLSAGHFAGLKFAEGWWFIQAIGSEYNELKPWVLKNDSGNREAVQPNSSGEEDQQIVDSTGENKVLEPNDRARNTVHQILFGVSPSRMQVFEKFGRNRTQAVEDYDQPGDPAPAISGFDSPYNNPSQVSELFYINDMDSFRVQPFNPTDEALKAKLSFHVNKLRYTTVTDKNLMKAMLQGQQPANLHMMGKAATDSNQVSIPSWLQTAFGEHVYETEEILSADSSESDDDRIIGEAAELEGVQ